MLWPGNTHPPAPVSLSWVVGVRVRPVRAWFLRRTWTSVFFGHEISQLQIPRTLYWSNKTTETDFCRPVLRELPSCALALGGWGVTYFQIDKIYNTKGSVSSWGKCHAQIITLVTMPSMHCDSLRASSLAPQGKALAQLKAFFPDTVSAISFQDSSSNSYPVFPFSKVWECLKDSTLFFLIYTPLLRDVT